MKGSAMDYPQITAVAALAEARLRVTFTDGSTKIYDCSALLREPAFAPLRDQALFGRAHVGPGGYGVVWNDEIDLSESELWLNGVDADGGS